jgi:translation initiation factor 3 subunit F
MDVKAFVFTQTQQSVAPNLLQFHQVPLEVKASPAEKAGISQMMQVKGSGDSKPIDAIDGFNLGLKELLKLFRRMQEYVKAVKDGRTEGDLAVGRGLTGQLCTEPVIATEAIENLCKTSLQDSLMVVYLSNLLRTQISMAEKIQALYGDVVAQPLPQSSNYSRGEGGERRQGICLQWQAGSCSYGDNCRYSHV